MRRVWRKLATLSRRLEAKLPSSKAKSVKPGFDLDDLFSDLREPGASVQAWREGHSEVAWTTLVDHFCQRKFPVIFFAPSDVSGLLIKSDLCFPTWRARLLAKVEEDRRQGLAIYDLRGAPLSAEFDWRAVPENPLHDRLYLARPRRFGFLPRWALACHYDPTLVAALESILAGWITEATRQKSQRGFDSSHVALYRIMALLLAWPLISALDGQNSDKDGLASLPRRALQILYEDSRYLSSVAGSAVPNNHLLAERFGCWLIARLLPEFTFALEPGAAEDVWLEELKQQTYEDGGSTEHSVHYQEHACEMAVAYLLLSRANDWPIPEWAETRIEHMLQFQLTLTGPTLVPLPVGNTTEDPLMPLGVGEGWQIGALREIYRACFGPGESAASSSDTTVETAFWLLNGGLTPAVQLDDTAPEFRAFPQGGFHVFDDPTQQSRLIHRLGPTPHDLSIGGHSHNDLLSLYLTVQGKPVLAAPGTYSYRFKPHPTLPDHPNLHAHFASAQSRSGLVFEGEEHYGPLKGDFRDWKLPCQVEARHAHAPEAGLSWGEGVVVGAGAYSDYRRGVIHVLGQYWLIYDILPLRQKESQTNPAASIGWQFAPGVVCLEQANGLVQLRLGELDSLLSMVSCETGSTSLMSGCHSPFRGWVSPSYGRLEPAANLRFSVPPTTQTVAFLIDPAPATKFTPKLDLEFTQEHALGFVINRAGEQTQILINYGEEIVETVWGDIAFAGRLLEVCRGGEGSLQIKALGMRRLKMADIELDLEATETDPADVEILIHKGAVTWPQGRSRKVKVDGHAA